MKERISTGKQWYGGVRWYLLGTLVALELLMSFSFLGYFHVEPISITIAYIPVLLAGSMMGPGEAAAVGAVFGLASMWKASASYVMAFDQLFSPMMSGQPLESILLSVGSRALFGLVVGLLYLAARRLPHPALWIGVVSWFGRTIHAAMVYGMMWICFPEAGYTPLDALLDLPNLNGILTSVVSACVTLAAWRAEHSQLWDRFRRRVELARSFQDSGRYHVVPLVVIILVTLLSSVAVAVYFVQRMATVLSYRGVTLSEEGYADLFHLQIQFLMGMLAMMALLVVFLICNRWYSTYMDWEAKRDALTGALNRKAFFQSCERALGKEPDGLAGYFIMVDMDHFKEINDRYGHLEGDRVLREAAAAMREVFGHSAQVGRLGGDEFAVFLYAPLPRESLEITLRNFLNRMHQIQWGGERMGCSIGAQPITPGQSAEALYRAADDLLYEAKARGKDRFVIGTAADREPELQR